MRNPQKSQINIERHGNEPRITQKIAKTTRIMKHQKEIRSHTI